jgi:hypothetical protein
MRNVIGICGKEMVLLASDTGREQIVRFACVTSLWVERRKQKVSAHLCKKVAAVCWNRENPVRKKTLRSTRDYAYSSVGSADLGKRGGPIAIPGSGPKC